MFIHILYFIYLIYVIYMSNKGRVPLNIRNVCEYHLSLSFSNIKQE